MNRINGWLIGAVLIPFLYPILIRYITKWIGDEFIFLVNQALESGDGDDDILIIAIVTWIDKKADKELAANEKIEHLAAFLCEKVRFLKYHNKEIVELLSAILKKVEEKAKQIEIKNENATTKS